MKIELNKKELEFKESIINKFNKYKKMFIKLISFKGRYIIGNYLFIRSKYWYGYYKSNTDCPNFKYSVQSLIFCKWIITKIK